MQPELFDSAAKQLEQNTDLDRLEARGTLRIALKQAGLDPNTLTLHELGVVFEKVMPSELEMRGVGDAAEICGALIRNLNVNASPTEATSSSIDDIFSRLGGDA